MEADFSGWATKNGLKCSDGRTIMPGAFKHHNSQKVPLVWQHRHDDPVNVLGHALLEDRPEGIYAYGFFNENESGKMAKHMVQHGDVESLSIFANNLSERGKQVFHGNIREVSLVLSGANPGALIDNVNLSHSIDDAIEEAVITTGLTLEHADNSEEGDNVATTETEGKTVKDVFDAMSEEQKNVVYYMIGEATDGDLDEDKDEDGDAEDVAHSMAPVANYLQHSITESIKEGFSTMSRNVFESNAGSGAGGASKGGTLTHSQVQTIVQDAVKGGSFKDAFLAHAGEYGITNIDLMFPDAKAVSNEPDLLARQAEWVPKVLGATKHAPFAKIKSLVADLTAAEARAKGYIKGNEKTEEVIQLLRRTTGPATVYKKQKLDRDDIIDITDFDVIAWLKWEIRFMLNEEIARAILIGDGRSITSNDKVKDPQGSTDGTGIRSIYKDNDLYAHKVDLPTNVSAEAIIDEVSRARTHYRGSGTPTFYTTDKVLTDLLLLKDKMGRRLYETEAALASALRVKEIVAVEVMEEEAELLGIMVNLTDYTVGTNRGGEMTFFDDFDIDFNQNKYLMETRMSGALTKPKSAIVIRRSVGQAVTLTAPSFNGATNTITVPTTTGVSYIINDEVVTGDVVIEADTEIMAVANEGYYIPANSTRSWAFTYTEA